MGLFQTPTADCGKLLSAGHPDDDGAVRAVRVLRTASGRGRVNDLGRNPGACFVAALAAAVVPAGGWAAYGAARTIWNLIDPPVHGSAAYTRVVDAALEFLRSSGVPPMRLNGHEWDHWISRGGTIDTWIPIRPRPSTDDAVVTPLQPSEVRRVAKLGPEANANVILVAEADGAFVALVDAKWSDEDPRRERSEWKRSSTLYDLYVDVALALQAPPTWCADELEPFFPIPRPRI